MKKIHPGHGLPPLESIRDTAALLEHELFTNITIFSCGIAMPSIQLSNSFPYRKTHIILAITLSTSFTTALCHAIPGERSTKKEGTGAQSIMERSLLRHFEEGSSETGVLGRYKGSYLPNVPRQATSVRWARVYQSFTAPSRSKSILGSSIFRSRIRGQLFAIVETRLMYERVHINRAQHLTLTTTFPNAPFKIFSPDY